MRRPFLAAILTLVHAAVLCAQTTPTTRLVPYAGLAQDASGAPLRGSVTVTFALYEEHEGGAPLWRETQQVQTDDQGRYLAYLGTAHDIPQAAFSEERARWLAVVVGDRELPRVMLAAVPYALRAADADALGGLPASSFVRKRADGRLESGGVAVADPLIDGSGTTNSLAKFNSPTTITSATIAEAGGRVGFGLADPTGGGVVDSVFSIRNFDNNTGFAVLNQTQQRRFALNTSADGSWVLYDGANGTWNRGLTQRGGSLQIGFFMSPIATFTATTTCSGCQAVFGIGFGDTTGVAGEGRTGVSGIGSTSGVYGQSTTGSGVRGSSDSGPGVFGESIGGLAGEFAGNVAVSGTLSKGGGSFTIDHPLDPIQKYLRHSFVESPDMMNVYNGNVALDSEGAAWVTLPEWFEALNRDFRYQLTAIGAPGPNLHVASKVSGNRFKIAGGTPGSEVSWQVTGIRQDAWANAHRIVVEEDKPENERGTYLHAREHGQPESASSALNGRPATEPKPKPQ